eukprot:scaffold66139_cov69-Phaeocystis_antarctica.AAC.3
MGLAATRHCSSSSSTAAPSVAVFASSHSCCRSHHSSSSSSHTASPSASSSALPPPRALPCLSSLPAPSLSAPSTLSPRPFGLPSGLPAGLDPSTAHKASSAADPAGDAAPSGVVTSSGTRHAVKRRSVEHDHLGVEHRRLGDSGRASLWHQKLPLRPGRLSRSSQVRSVAKSLQSQAQKARLASYGTRQDGHPRRALFSRAGVRNVAAGPVHAAHCAAVPAAQGRRRRARRRQERGSGPPPPQVDATQGVTADDVLTIEADRGDFGAASERSDPPL